MLAAPGRLHYSENVKFQNCVVTENCALLGYYAATSGNFLPTFRDNLMVPSSGFKNPKESLQKLPLRYNPEEHSSQLLCSESLKSCTVLLTHFICNHPACLQTQV